MVYYLHFLRDHYLHMDRQQQEIHFAGADEFGKVRAVHEEKRLVNLLDETARAGEQHHLPHRPRADGGGLAENHADEGELQSEPGQFDDNPEEEVALERHFARDGSFPQRGVNGEVTYDAIFRLWTLDFGLWTHLPSKRGVFPDAAPPRESRQRIRKQQP